MPKNISLRPILFSGIALLAVALLLTLTINDVTDPPPALAQDPCAAVSLGPGVHNGNLEDGCLDRGEGQRLGANYKKYFILLTSEPTKVLLSVESDDFDPYLIMERPSGQITPPYEARIWENDDINASVGNFSAGLIMDVPRGLYNVYVTSYSRSRYQKGC